LRVFIQLEGDCNGVYITNKTSTGFDVIELKGGVSNVQFQWNVVCNVADEKFDNGNISKNADLRFEPAPAPEKGYSINSVPMTFKTHELSKKYAKELNIESPKLNLLKK
jgi:hypothetical protein